MNFNRELVQKTFTNDKTNRGAKDDGFFCLYHIDRDNGSRYSNGLDCD